MTSFEKAMVQIGDGTPWHSLSVGNCTMTRTPGFFAMVCQEGSAKVCSAEGSTPDEAIENMLVKLAGQKPAVRKMPGL